MMKKFNALDIFICVMIFAAVTAMALYMGGGPANSVMASEQKTVYFTVEVTFAQVGFSEKISIGDTISDSTRGYYYGEVSEVEVEPMKLTTLNSTDKIMMRSDVPERETILLTVKCNGTESVTEITAEGQVIKIGKRLTLKGKGYAMTGYIIGMRTEA